MAGEEQLVIVYEVERQYRKANLQEVIQLIRQAVAEQHQLQVHAVVLIKPTSIPKTSSGKIQRHACKDRYLHGTLDVLASSEAATELEEATSGCEAETLPTVPVDQSRGTAAPSASTTANGDGSVVSKKLQSCCGCQAANGVLTSR